MHCEWSTQQVRAMTVPTIWAYFSIICFIFGLLQSQYDYLLCLSRPTLLSCFFLSCFCVFIVGVGSSCEQLLREVIFSLCNLSNLNKLRSLKMVCHRALHDQVLIHVQMYCVRLAPKECHNFKNDTNFVFRKQHTHTHCQKLPCFCQKQIYINQRACMIKKRQSF
jgi:hypothetical protein